MSEDKALRFYARPLKLVLLILAPAAFVALGIWMLRTPDISADQFNVVVAWAAVGFFGLGAVVLLIIFVRNVVFRLPVLQIDEQGWVTRTTLFVKKQTANWQDIDHVAIYRQWARQSLIRRRPEYMYWLVVHGVDPTKVARRSRFSARMYRFYPALGEALMVVSLNNLFIRPTEEKVERVIERIRARYDVELRLNQIRFDTQIHRL
jgi:hypothetical protein